MQKNLLNFDVAIDPFGDGYRTHVLDSPVGQAQADFVLPFTDKDLENLVLKVLMSIGRIRRQVRRIGSQERQLLEAFGGELFRAVFSGPVRECLGRSRLVAGNSDAGLRIRLRLPPALVNIPWEYLYDATEHGFIGLAPEITLVRYLEMPSPARPFPVSPPLRVLAMISAPGDLAALDAEDEWGKLSGALDPMIRAGLVEVDRLEGGTLAALQLPLRRREYHVLHFIGHGGYDTDAQDGALAMEGADRTIRLVTGRDLGLMIRDHRPLRLVVLNACEGARSASDDPFGGVAQALVRQGIPAVIAMQFEISDPAALVFSQSFYQAIADGLPVDVATVEARRAMFFEGNEVEWATPVLYLRSPDGRVFTTDRVREAEEQAQRKEQDAHQELKEIARVYDPEQATVKAESVKTITEMHQPYKDNLDTNLHPALSSAMFRANLARTGVYSPRPGARPPGWRPWKTRSDGRIDSSVSLSNGVVYYGSQDCCLYARDNIEGTLLWQFRSGKPIRSSPAIAADTVFVGSDDGRSYALDVGTGQVRWSFRTARLIRSSPAVAGGIVYVGSGRHLYSLDAATGKLRWRYSTGDWVCSSPAVAGDSVYVGSDDGNLHAIHALTGTPKWRFDTGKPVRSSPAIAGDSIYVGSDDGCLHAIQAVTGTPKWRFETGGRVYSSPAIANGVVYIGSQDHHLYALDISSGQRLWGFRSGGEVDSSPAADGTAVYVGSDDGYLYALDAATRQPA